ncbi:hypothetical protein GX48_04185 [Paracoccidioides brasiliensis]|nr:hypothetical protein GX48_04185 [Paracoccidioides brasiliensis]
MTCLSPNPVKGHAGHSHLRSPTPRLRFTTLSASDHSLAGMGPCPKVPALPWVVAWRGSYQKWLAQHLGAGVGRKWLLQKTQTAKTALTAKLKLITWF